MAVSPRKKLWLLGFAVFTALLGGAALASYEEGEKTYMLPAKTSHGHYQIEMSCETCHTPYEGVKQDACLQCHGEELEHVDDSHPAKKFRDPRNADLLSRIDAMKCITCHREHVPDETRAMGVTEPDDLCVHCHSDIGEERESHKGMAFTTCRDSGCHNFHDNRTLNEEFLEKHLDEPPLLPNAQAEVSVAIDAGVAVQPPAETPDAPQGKLEDDVLVAAWQASAHAHGGANCNDCHANDEQEWIEEPGHQVCAECHESEHATFLLGKHGMRLKEGLPPMRPADARQPMKADAAHRELTCNSCHRAHEYDVTHAAVDACVSCHNDAHTLAYATSPHGKSWTAAVEAGAPLDNEVSCATCHMPQATGPDGSFTNHNQNDNLRPSTKMLKDVCGDCHGVPFAIDALADTKLVDNNFAGQPARHVETIDMVERRMTDD